MKAGAGVWRQVGWVGLLLLALVPIWWSLGDHPLAHRSEGRYAAVSRTMAEGGSWLLPVLRGEPHLTKPPLTYWAEAATMRVLGVGELAARVPSAAAGTATAAMVLLLGWRLGGVGMGGWRRGVTAGVLLLAMPLPLVLSRLTLTDSILGFFWMGTLACGYLAWSEASGRAKRWAVVGLWTAVAGGLITKGPVAWVPLGVLAVWHAAAGRPGELLRLRPGVGGVLSAIPLLAWAGSVAVQYPEAVDLWWHEMGERAIGRGDHNQPMWFFIPVLIAGLFPATVLLDLPLKRADWGRVRRRVRGGGEAALWAWAVVLPFVMFSVISGKLMSYLLPLAPPLALLASGQMVRWFDGRGGLNSFRWEPSSLGRVVIVLTVGCIGGFIWMRYTPGGGVVHDAIPLSPILLLASIVPLSLAGWWYSSRGAGGRAAAAGMVAAVWMAAMCIAVGAQDPIARLGSWPDILRSVRERGLPTGGEAIAGYRIGDDSMAYYIRDAEDLQTPAELRAWAVRPEPGPRLVILQQRDWRGIVKRYNGTSRKFREVFEVDRRFGREPYVVVVTGWLGK